MKQGCVINTMMENMQQIEKLIYLYGYRVICTEALGKYVQKRRNKKKRINKKWKKRYGFKNVPDGNKIILCDYINTILVHPITWEKMKKQLNF